MQALGGEPYHYKANLIPQACELLERERTERAKQVVLLIDEAHLLSPAQLEELPLLTNAEMDSQSPFAGILLGQPTLRKAAAAGNVRGARSADRAALRADRHDRAGDRQTTSTITSSSQAARTRCSPMTRSRCCTAPAAGFPDS
jgi:type II secretory pathway predicted ATPase ExeA